MTQSRWDNAVQAELGGWDNPQKVTFVWGPRQQLLHTEKEREDPSVQDLQKRKSNVSMSCGLRHTSLLRPSKQFRILLSWAEQSALACP